MDQWFVITSKKGKGDETRKSAALARPASAVAERGRSTRTVTRPVGRARSVDSDDNVSTGRSRRRPKTTLSTTSSSTTHRAATSSSRSAATTTTASAVTSRSARTAAAAEPRSRAPPQGVSAVLSNPGLLPWFYALGPNMFVGRKPKSVKELAILQKLRVSAIVSVVQPHEHDVPPEQTRALGFNQLQLSVREGDPLSLRQLIEGIRFLRLVTEVRGGTVYVHCRKGRVRCVMLSCAYVMARKRLDPAEAEELVVSAVPCGKLRRKHRETLAALSRVLRARAADDSFTMF